MKKDKKFSELAAKDLSTKRTELVKELVKFRVSMDTTAIQHEGGLAGLRRDLKQLSRETALKSSKGK